MIWVLIVFMMKMMLIGVMMLFEAPLEALGDFLLKVFDGYPRVELVFIMVVFPVFLNALLFWITDGYLKNNDPTPEITATTKMLNEGKDDFLNYSSLT